jgi:hypothetical protein
VARAISKCPDCGSTVSQFAAGCAVCGFDLVTARQEREQRYARLSVPGTGRLPHITGEDFLIGALMIIVAFASPILGGVIAGLFALQANNERNIPRRNLCLVAVGVAVLMLILISLLPGTYSRLVFSLYS